MPNIESAYCPECRRRRVVEDTSMESAYEGGSAMAWERHFLVQYLDCGHTKEFDRGTTNTAPGAPYAGPQVAVAATTRHRDLQAARERQAVLDDPWGEGA